MEVHGNTTPGFAADLGLAEIADAPERRN